MTDKAKRAASAVGLGFGTGMILTLLTGETWWAAVGLAVGSGIGIARK
jgi:hypothetical protein